MNDSGGTGAGGTSDLQFDKAEIGAQATTACTACKRTSFTSYFAINGKVFCEACRNAIVRQLAQSDSPAKWAYVAGLGLGAAVISGIGYGLTRLIGYNLGIVAIAVGWLVGTAVKRGAGASRGVAHQVLAVALTYVAVAISFAPAILKEISGRADLTASIVARVLAVCLKAPVLDASPIGILIFGFALYQAFTVTRPVKIAITGPFQVNPSAPAPEPATEASVA